MYKDLFFKLISLPYSREILNCILRYLLAQPVEMDFMVVAFLAAEYFGLSAFLFGASDNKAINGDQTSEELVPA
jgi:hypothetical protein